MQFFARRAREKLERETGIEPATNSLEGCDSTTELLPPARRLSVRPRRFGEASPLLPSKNLLLSPALRSAFHHRSASQPSWKGRSALSAAAESHLACQPKLAPRARRLVARGGFEPPKPLGRQIYSLLRLTASLPRRIAPHPAPPFSRADETTWHATGARHGFPQNCLDCSPFATSPADRRAEIPLSVLSVLAPPSRLRRLA